MRTATFSTFLCAAALAIPAAPGAASLVDRTFNPGRSGANSVVEDIREQPDGKVIICGGFAKYNDEECYYLARLNADGTRDTSFNPASGAWVRHITLQPDGKIIVSGFFSYMNYVPRNRIARLNADGTIDPTFNPGRGAETTLGVGINNDPSPFIMWTELLPDGKILAVGNFRHYNGVSSPGIVRINPDGSRDATFNVGNGLDSWGRHILLLGNGQIMVSGWFNAYHDRWFNRMVRLNANGSADTTFNPYFGDKTAIYSVVALPDGKYIAAGHSLNDQGLFSREIARLNADGTQDPAWVGKTNEKTECLLPQPNGKVIAAGYFWTANDQTRLGLARFNADGTLDDGFRADTSQFVWTISPGRNQRVWICGAFDAVDGIPQGRIARLNLPERPDDPTGPGPTITNARRQNGKFECSLQSNANSTYILQYRGGLNGVNWTSLPGVPGTGGSINLQDTEASETRFYRVEVR